MSKDKVCNNGISSCFLCLRISFSRFFLRRSQPTVNRLLLLIQFESLPNDMILEHFKYLHTFDFYHSFGQLNSRLNELIRQSLLKLNLQHVRKAVFDQYCQQLSLKPDTKNRNKVHVIKLKDFCHIFHSMNSLIFDR